MIRTGLLALLMAAGMWHTATAQEVIYSEYDKFDFRNGDYSVVGKVGGRLYTYRGSSDGFYLDAYNDTMGKLATVVLDFFPKKIYETKFAAYGDHMIVLYQALESNRVIQYAALLDDMGRLQKGPLALDTVKMGLFGPNRGYFSATLSEDKQYILLYGAVVRGTELRFRYSVLNAQLDVQRGPEVVYTGDNNIAAGDAMISNAGNIYLPAYTPNGSKGFADRFWLLSLQPGQTAFTAKELPLNNQFLGTSYMKIDNANNRIYAGGFYSDKRNGNYEGILYAYYDIASGTYPTHKFIDFDPQLRLATGERNSKRAFNDFQVRQLIVKNDGGFVLVAEDYFITSRNNFSPGFGYYSWYYPSMASSVREYHYNDIITLSYSGDGNREWHTFIRKDQYSQEDGGMFSSYALINTGGTLGFLYNDFNSNRSRIQLAGIDAAGKLTVRTLSTAPDDPDWLPRSGKQISAHEIVVPCLRKRQLCFAKIVF